VTVADPIDRVLDEVYAERVAQNAKWGEQNHPDGTSRALRHFAIARRRACQRAAVAGTVTWRHIFDEEYAEACAEEDPAKLRAELVQVAAVAVAWVEAIDRRAA
jgi:hypothetical protein